MPPPRRRPTSTTTIANIGANFKNDQAFALAAASLRQALQDMPELTEASKHIMVEETKEGLNIEIVDQDGRSMFPEGSKEPYERTRVIIQKIAGPLKATPYRVSITGHTAATRTSRRSPITGHGTCRPTAPMRCARSSKRQGCPSANFYEVGRQGRHRSAVPRRPLHGGQSPRDHHPDARGAAGSAGFEALMAAARAVG